MQVLLSSLLWSYHNNYNIRKYATTKCIKSNELALSHFPLQLSWCLVLGVCLGLIFLLQLFTRIGFSRGKRDSRGRGWVVLVASSTIMIYYVMYLGFCLCIYHLVAEVAALLIITLVPAILPGLNAPQSLSRWLGRETNFAL